ncbi:MAG: ABC transporter ATP-binding protein, partial [Caldilineaceae bacterium]|nr:ABC transporter ATP-binding protein [Caldilineaceae bacterium]
IRVGGRPAQIHAPRDAIAAGIGMVTQHFALVAPLTVTENIILGQPGGIQLDMESAHADVLAASGRFGLEIDPRARIRDLSVGQRQRVEILKALYRDANVLILDEPTAVLTPQEIEGLFEVMELLKAQGKSIIFITHKLKEVLRVADTIAVMRDGRMVGTVAPADTNPAALSRMMVGRDVLLTTAKDAATPGSVKLDVRGLTVHDDRALPAVRELSLQVRAGEIVGIAGVQGNGQRELEEALGGLRPVAGGRITLGAHDVTNASPRAVFNAGLGHVPSDRYKTALLRDFSIADNLVLETVDRPPFTRRGLLRRQAIAANAVELIKRFDVRTRSPRTQVAKLSGGNAQKVVLARALSHNPDVLLVAQPTRGVDIGAIEYIHRELVARRDAGMAILLISTELDEILNLSDRIIVLHAGEVMGEVVAGAGAGAAAVDVERLGLMMAGTRQTELDAAHG